MKARRQERRAGNEAVVPAAPTRPASASSATWSASASSRSRSSAAIWTASSTARRISATGRRRSRSASPRRSATTTTSTYTYRGHGQCLARGMDLEAAFGELFGRETGVCGGARRLDAPDRHGSRPDRRLRHRRRRPAGGGRRRALRPARRPRAGLGLLLRRRRHQYRRLPRSDEHRPGVEAAADLRLREQSLRRVQPHQPHDALRGPDHPRRRLRDDDGRGRRQRRRGGLRGRRPGGRPRPRRRRTDLHRMQDLSPPRPLAHRSGESIATRRRSRPG